MLRRPRSPALLSFATLMGTLACSGPAPGGDAAAGTDGAVRDAGADAPRSDAGGAVPTWVGVTHGTIKLRPAATLPTERVATIEAARNEWEPYQIAFSGGTEGIRITSVTPSALVGPGGATIPASASYVYAERYVTLPSPSNAEGAPGPWPDPLVPVVDLIAGEPRNAFPIDVPGLEIRAVWIDVLVPEGAAPGDYTGSVHVVSSIADFDVPVSLHVFDFALPSTPSLRTLFGGVGDAPCIAHHVGAWSGGAWDACADTDPGGDGDRLTEHYRTQYMQLALEYRISLGGGTYVGPSDAAGLAHFDATYGALLDGTAPTHLAGSHLTTLQIQYNGPPSTARTQLMVDHVASRGWDAVVLDYTVDEPESNGVCPGGGTCPAITDRAAIVRAGGARSLVTAQLRYAEPNGFADAVQILVPIVTYTRPPTPVSTVYQPVSDYAAWLGADAQNLLWWYQSCMSHGCGAETACGSADEDVTGQPSYVIDASAMQNRAMEWLSYARGVSGELYFDTAYALDRAWDDPCSFGGAGDGTMFYPGRPDRIGGTTDVPLASIRMALVREGLEDYEYLHLLASRGGEAEAMQIASGLFEEVDRVDRPTAATLYAARHAAALAIEARR
ncbi:MAG: DUF4091 domain-containing protein [Sandaracinus sp.]